MKIKILILRHGKTKGNLEGRYIGSKTDESLCAEGIDELENKKKALNTLTALTDKNVSVYASPMKRAVETAELLFPASLVHVISNLKEIDFGDFENKNYQELNSNSDYQAWIDSGGRNDYPGGEKLDLFIKRSIDGFNEVVSDVTRSNKDSAAVICHGGNIMAIMSNLTGKDYFDFQVKNGHGYLLELEVEGTEVDLISYSLI